MICSDGFAVALQAIAAEFDERAGIDARLTLLRAAGRRIADRFRLPPCATLEALVAEANAILVLVGWGRVAMMLVPDQSVLRIEHEGMPLVASLGEPIGHWLSSVLEGLYEGWLAAQPDAQGCEQVVSIVAGAVDPRPGRVVLLAQGRSPGLSGRPLGS